MTAEYDRGHGVLLISILMVLSSALREIAVTGLWNRAVTRASTEREWKIASGRVEEPPLRSEVSVMLAPLGNSQHVLEALPFCIWVGRG